MAFEKAFEIFIKDKKVLSFTKSDSKNEYQITVENGCILTMTGGSFSSMSVCFARILSSDGDIIAEREDEMD